MRVASSLRATTGAPPSAPLLLLPRSSEGGGVANPDVVVRRKGVSAAAQGRAAGTRCAKGCAGDVSSSCAMASEASSAKCFGLEFG